MDIGEFNCRVDIKRCLQTRTVHGGITKTWDVIAQRWAKISLATGVESSISDKKYSIVSVDIYVRNYKWLSPNDRIYWESNDVTFVYEIESIVCVDEEQRWTKVKAKQVWDNY
jgi:head-tail adaptor